ncbi:MAG TPA: hypothetical protein VF624_02485 [Tepidisphaeraceae bacterium]|jgi:nucleoside phosphorylase
MTLKQFAAAISGFSQLSHNERVALLLWFYNDIEKIDRVHSAKLVAAYKELSIDPPQNFGQHIRQLEDRRPKVVLRDSKGIHLEKRKRDSYWRGYGEAVTAAMSVNPEDAEANRADVGIVVALREEFSELHIQVPNWEPCPVLESGGFDYLFNQESSVPDRPYRCVVTFVGEMTHTPSAMETQRLLRTWRPRSIVNLGIAGSLDADCLLGDVVVGSVVDDYLARAKAIGTADDAGWQFELSGEPYRPSAALSRFASHVQFAHAATHSAFQDKAAQDLKGLLTSVQYEALVRDGLVREKPHLHLGHIASGQIVGASAAFTAWLKQQRDRSYLAIEMEAAGVLAAVHQQIDPQRAIIIRGISDLGDERKKKFDSIGKGAIRVYSMRNCVRFLFMLMSLGAFPFEDTQ